MKPGIFNFGKSGISNKLKEMLERNAKLGEAKETNQQKPEIMNLGINKKVNDFKDRFENKKKEASSWVIPQPPVLETKSLASRFPISNEKNGNGCNNKTENPFKSKTNSKKPSIITKPGNDKTDKNEHKKDGKNEGKDSEIGAKNEPGKKEEKSEKNDSEINITLKNGSDANKSKNEGNNSYNVSVNTTNNTAENKGIKITETLNKSNDQEVRNNTSKENYRDKDSKDNKPNKPLVSNVNRIVQNMNNIIEERRNTILKTQEKSNIFIKDEDVTIISGDDSDPYKLHPRNSKTNQMVNLLNNIIKNQYTQAWNKSNAVENSKEKDKERNSINKENKDKASTVTDKYNTKTAVDNNDTKTNIIKIKEEKPENKSANNIINSMSRISQIFSNISQKNNEGNEREKNKNEMKADKNIIKDKPQDCNDSSNKSGNEISNAKDNNENKEKKKTESDNTNQGNNSDKNINKVSNNDNNVLDLNKREGKTPTENKQLNNKNNNDNSINKLNNNTSKDKPSGFKTNQMVNLLNNMLKNQMISNQNKGTNIITQNTQNKVTPTSNTTTTNIATLNSTAQPKASNIPNPPKPPFNPNKPTVNSTAPNPPTTSSTLPAPKPLRNSKTNQMVDFLNNMLKNQSNIISTEVPKSVTPTTNISSTSFTSAVSEAKRQNLKPKEPEPDIMNTDMHSKIKLLEMQLMGSLVGKKEKKKGDGSLGNKVESAGVSYDPEGDYLTRMKGKTVVIPKKKPKKMGFKG